MPNEIVSNSPTSVAFIRGHNSSIRGFRPTERSYFSFPRSAWERSLDAMRPEPSGYCTARAWRRSVQTWLLSQSVGSSEKPGSGMVFYADAHVLKVCGALPRNMGAPARRCVEWRTMPAGPLPWQQRRSTGQSGKDSPYVVGMRVNLTGWFGSRPAQCCRVTP